MYSDELIEDVIAAVKLHGSNRKAAEHLPFGRFKVDNIMKVAASRGMLGYDPVLPGFRVSEIKTQRDSDGNKTGESIRQQPERGEVYKVPEGHTIKGVSTLVDPDGRKIIEWVKTREQDVTSLAWRDAFDEFKKDLPRIAATAPNPLANEKLCTQYTLTDLHFGMLAWAEETGDADYDLQIAEKLLIDWFSAAVAMSPASHTAIFAQLGDLFHYDSMRSETPEHRNLLDADSRPQKMIRVVIRVIRQVIRMLLEKHAKVHVIMAKANHDPYSSAWLRETLSVMYEDEPRLTVDTSPAEYYVFEFGQTALFYHHGHKRQVSNVDTVFAGMFREIYGRCKHSFAHIGHLHNNEAKDGNLMYVERHRTLAPTDSYAAGGGWLSKRDAKVIVYHREFGEVSRLTLSPEMVQSG